MVKSDWQRSSFCGGGGNNCVEVAATRSDGIALRESENPADMVATDRAALDALIRSLRRRTV
ncbi:DUF397 domain-containing protein [Streptomyces sp. NPDC046465]|uniref:DUF397 domain-containing protein n=1 Tax=Streptomyces sp. NPDC046465 TaxID=3155810 RepID=UPI0033C67D8E